MTDSRNPVHSKAARFSAGGASRGRGMVLLYPDELAVVKTPMDTWGLLVVPAFYTAVTLPLFHAIGWAGIVVGSLVGGWLGNVSLKKRATRKAVASGDRMAVIPLDQVTDVRISKPAGIGGWWRNRVITVTTADGAEYGFHGTMAKWQAYLTRAMTERGRPATTPRPGSGY